MTCLTSKMRVISYIVSHIDNDKALNVKNIVEGTLGSREGLLIKKIVDVRLP